jgi:hypothetical protein
MARHVNSLGNNNRTSAHRNKTRAVASRNEQTNGPGREQGKARSSRRTRVLLTVFSFNSRLLRYPGGARVLQQRRRILSRGADEPRHSHHLEHLDRRPSVFLAFRHRWQADDHCADVEHVLFQFAPVVDHHALHYHQERTEGLSLCALDAGNHDGLFGDPHVVVTPPGWKVCFSFRGFCGTWYRFQVLGALIRC